ncbi:MAG: DUF1189 family protein [Clostridia bacterium]|nr:DUF1189 family protein [Clostridia bacterium]
MKLGKINFFKRLYLAIADFRLYPYAQKESLTTAVGYFVKLLLLSSVIISAFVTNNVFEESPIMLEIFNNNMPEFIIENGTLDTTENVEKEINKNTYLIVNDEYKHSNMKNIVMPEKNYDYYIFSLSDITIISANIDGNLYEVGSVTYEDISLSKQQLIMEWKLLNESAISRLVLWIIISVGMLIALIILRAWALIMYLISTYIINFLFGLKMKITDYLKVTIYASTLPIILEVIALILVGSISESVNFISVLVSCVYIFYALRAIKLDTLILGGSGKTAEEKIKNALAHAQEELEKQLEELEKREENEKSKEDEKRELEKLNLELKEKEENLMKAQKEYEAVLKKIMDTNPNDEMKDKTNK